MANYGLYLDQRYDPPFEDWWSFKMIDHDMKNLSEELLALPVPLPPYLERMSRIIEKAIIRRNSEWESIP